jgi:hypothetical protein
MNWLTVLILAVRLLERSSEWTAREAAQPGRVAKEKGNGFLYLVENNHLNMEGSPVRRKNLGSMEHRNERYLEVTT